MASRSRRPFNPLTTPSSWRIQAKKNSEMTITEVEVIVKGVLGNGVTEIHADEKTVTFTLSYTCRRERLIERFGNFAEGLVIASGTMIRLMVWFR